MDTINIILCVLLLYAIIRSFFLLNSLFFYKQVTLTIVFNVVPTVSGNYLTYQGAKYVNREKQITTSDLYSCRACATASTRNRLPACLLRDINSIILDYLFALFNKETTTCGGPIEEVVVEHSYYIVANTCVDFCSIHSFTLTCLAQITFVLPKCEIRVSVNKSVLRIE